ncbi:HEPN domain-containing protein [Lactobacillus crispatus]|uniref:HEPN domain-containing protein n=1 Tax=Lactobacillus crispatus TaxID=47770 RepID=UPI001C4E258B|nr:HEPN domain-containing protein [Lactobacillus crispatus]MBW0438096.1 hypothetical protein [Lactobacillus crispatus]
MKKRNTLNNNLRETTHSEFALMGYFSLDSSIDKLLKGSVGKLEYKNGIASIEVATAIQQKSDKSGGTYNIENESDGVIYGILEDGTFVRLNKFHCNHWVRHIPGFSTATYTAYDIDFSKEIFTQNSLLNYSWIKITLDSLSTIGSFIIPDINQLKGKDQPLVKIGTTDNFDAYLSYEWKHSNNGIAGITYKTNITVDLDLKIKRYSNDAYVFFNNFRNFLSVLNDFQVNITSIRYINEQGNTILLRLYKSSLTDRNGKLDYLNVCHNELYFQEYRDKLLTIFKNINNADNKFNLLVQNYIYNIDDELSLDSALINYVNAVDIYMNGRKYSNGKPIRNLASKFKFWIKELPNTLYSLFFDVEKRDHEDPKIKKFITSIVDTRDYLTHYEKQNSAFLLNDSNRLDYIIFLRALIHVYILYKYGIPENSIKINYEGMELKNRI